MNKKKLSIIIPVYNCELYIGKLLNQLDQLDKDLVEIIIVNDGSTDNSYNILKNFQNKISNLNIITQTNHGVSYTRNVGIKHSSGDFIFFIDSDDEVIISSLTKLIDSLQTYE
ncbi:glycosyltransferase family 2 protein, partial [Coprobacillus cateniformis]